MNANSRAIVFADRSALVAGIAKRFTGLVNDLLSSQPEVHVVLTGGTVGIDSLGAIGDQSSSAKIDWTRLHLWWGDERWLPAGDSERNDAQAEKALLCKIDIPSSNIHRFPAADRGIDLADAARVYASTLETHALDGASYPKFDLVFLGVGPDGHIASLFPGFQEIRERELSVVAVRNSPKPPAERLSLTLPVINSASRVWLCLSGGDKSWALSLALAGADPAEVPAAAAAGRLETLFMVDRAAAADVPSELLLD